MAAKWKWEGIDKSGKKAQGELMASSEREVRKKLRQRGIRIKKVKAPSLMDFDIGEWLIEKGIGQSFGPKDIMRFTKQLGVMVNAGVPILQSLEILYKQERNPALKKAVKNISTEVGGGKTLADAMQAQKGFDRMYTSLVRAGETGGVLDDILHKLAIQLEKHEKTKSQIKSAMIYPISVVVIGVAVVYAMMVFVVPKFEEMLKDSGQEVPFLTQLVIDTSEWLQANTIYLIPGIILGIFVLKSYFATPTGKVVFDQLTMRIPLFGGIIIKGNLSAFSNTLATMLSSGVSLIDSLEISSQTVPNGIISKDIMKARKAVMEGKTLTEPLKKIKYFPEMVSQMIMVGEQTGELDSMLSKIAELFESELNDLIGGMTKMIEPIILVVLGGIVGTILIAMYMPIFMAAGGA